MIAAAAAAIAYATLGLVALRRPLLLRIAWRQIARRPGNSALMALGMMFATAGIMAMASTGDQLTPIVESMALNGTGHTDLVVSAGGRPFSPALAGRLAADPAVAGKVSVVQPTLELTGSAADVDRRLSASDAQVAAIAPAAGTGFGPFVLADNRRLAATALGANASVLTARLAGKLEARTGDRLQVLVSRPGGEPAALETRVAGIAGTDSGAAQSIQADVFVPLPLLQSALGAPVVNLIRVGAPGQGLAEAAAAHRAAPALRTALAAIEGGEGVQVLEIKSDALAALTGPGTTVAWFRNVIVGLSSVIVLAAVAVVVSLSLALAEERRTSLALLRALGLSRAGIVLIAALESAFFALAGALLGIGPGMAFGYREYLRIVARIPIHVDFSVQPDSVLLAVGGGILVTLGTVVAASLWSCRLTISAAIKALPEPQRPARAGWLRRIGIGAAGLAGVGLLLPRPPEVRELGGVLLIAAMIAAARGRVAERLRVTLGGAALGLWAAGIGAAVETGLVAVSDEGSVWLSVLSGLVGVWAGALVLAANLPLVERLIGLASSRAGAALRPPLAYLTRRPLRTALATGTIAMVLAGLTSFGSMLSSFTATVAQASQGWDVVVTSAGDARLALPAAVEPLVAAGYPIRTAVLAGESKHVSKTEDSIDWQYGQLQLYVLGDSQFDRPPVHLSYHDPRFPTEAAAWQAVRDTPGLAIMASGAAGDVTDLGDRSHPVELRLAGTTSSLVFGSQFGSWVIVSERTLAEVDPAGVGSLILVKAGPGTSPAALATEIRRDSYERGVDAVTTASLVADENRGVQVFASFFVDLLDVGLVVGVLSLGILAFRAAVERRRVIGILRALGYQRGLVLSSLLLESLLTAVVGVGLGIGVGALAGYVLALKAPNAYGLDWGQALWPGLLVCGAVLVTAIAPAVRAARIPAAEAVRLVD